MEGDKHTPLKKPPVVSVSPSFPKPSPERLAGSISFESGAHPTPEDVISTPKSKNSRIDVSITNNLEDSSDMEILGENETQYHKIDVGKSIIQDPKSPPSTPRTGTPIAEVNDKQYENMVKGINSNININKNNEHVVSSREMGLTKGRKKKRFHMPEIIQSKELPSETQQQQLPPEDMDSDIGSDWRSDNEEDDDDDDTIPPLITTEKRDEIDRRIYDHFVKRNWEKEQKQKQKQQGKGKKSVEKKSLVKDVVKVVKDKKGKKVVKKILNLSDVLVKTAEIVEKDKKEKFEQNLGDKSGSVKDKKVERKKRKTDDDETKIKEKEINVGEKRKRGDDNKLEEQETKKGKLNDEKKEEDKDGDKEIDRKVEEIFNDGSGGEENLDLKLEIPKLPPKKKTSKTKDSQLATKGVDNEYYKDRGNTPLFGTPMPGHENEFPPRIPKSLGMHFPSHEEDFDIESPFHSPGSVYSDEEKNETFPKSPGSPERRANVDSNDNDDEHGEGLFKSFVRKGKKTIQGFEEMYEEESMRGRSKAPYKYEEVMARSDGKTTFGFGFDNHPRSPENDHDHNGDDPIGSFGGKDIYFPGKRPIKNDIINLDEHEEQTFRSKSKSTKFPMRIQETYPHRFDQTREKDDDEDDDDDDEEDDEEDKSLEEDSQSSSPVRRRYGSRKGKGKGKKYIPRRIALKHQQALSEEDDEEDDDDDDGKSSSGDEKRELKPRGKGRGKYPGRSLESKKLNNPLRIKVPKTKKIKKKGRKHTLQVASVGTNTEARKETLKYPTLRTNDEIKQVRYIDRVPTPDVKIIEEEVRKKLKQKKSYEALIKNKEFEINSKYLLPFNQLEESFLPKVKPSMSFLNLPKKDIKRVRRRKSLIKEKFVDLVLPDYDLMRRDARKEVAGQKMLKKRKEDYVHPDFNINVFNSSKSNALKTSHWEVGYTMDEVRSSSEDEEFDPVAMRIVRMAEKDMRKRKRSFMEENSSSSVDVEIKKRKVIGEFDFSML